MALLTHFTQRSFAIRFVRKLHKTKRANLLLIRAGEYTLTRDIGIETAIGSGTGFSGTGQTEHCTQRERTDQERTVEGGHFCGSFRI